MLPTPGTRHFRLFLLLWGVFPASLVSPPGLAQVTEFPYAESFDSSPSLPPGWATTQIRNRGTDDFTVSTTASRSAPHCVAATNATVGQTLFSPVYDFSGVTPDALGWFTRRSASFNAAVVCEASLDSGATFTMQIGDSLRPSGTTAYIASLVMLPPALGGERRVRFRWRVIPDAAGTAGTLRFDDFTLGIRPPGDSASPGALVINEIMYEPLPAEAEYIELLNTGESPVNAAGWQLRDRTGTGVALPPDLGFIPPGGFALVAADSGIFRFFPELAQSAQELIYVPRSGGITLNNAGDDVVLCDAAGRRIDSVAYLPAWHNPAVQDSRGRSLERILGRGSSVDPGNWTTCVLPGGGTPAARNSVARDPGRSGAAVSCQPNPFSPDNDGTDDATVIHYTLPDGVWSVNVSVFDVRGRLVRRLISSMPGAGTGDVVWDGRDGDRVRARLGIYIVLIEAWEERKGTGVSAKGVVVLAGKL